MDSERAGELLRRERDRIAQALAQLGVPGTDELEGDGMADSGSRLYEEEFDEGQVDDLRAELASVKHAEERLAAGTFGLSVESGEPIPDERLEAVPAAERTVEEQTRSSLNDRTARVPTPKREISAAIAVRLRAGRSVCACRTSARGRQLAPRAQERERLLPAAA